ncbi:MAG: sugar phosphate isomerase/epimerase family protein, partial [Isosphaeraceae bacterium]
MNMSRRSAIAAAGLALAGGAARTAVGETKPTGMGIVIHSYGIRRFPDPLAFLRHCRALGAAGAQTSLGAPDDRSLEAIRAYAEENGLYLESTIGLPREREDLPRFTAEIEAARRCGVQVFRTVLMNGRRYEVFDSAEGFRQFREQARRALELALPVVEAHTIRMAIENHKDLQSPDLVELIRRLDSPWVGVCLDTGNNLALLED